MATTTLTVTRPGTASQGGVDPLLASYGATADTIAAVNVIVKRGLRAHIGSPQGTEQVVAGDQELVYFKCTTDPFPIEPRDRVTDERNGVVYDVVTAVTRDEFAPLAHNQVTIQRSQGLG